MLISDVLRTKGHNVVRIHPADSVELAVRKLAEHRIGVIEAWWGQRWPRANIGLATGAEPDFDALDIDPRHGGDVSLADLEAQHGRLPITIRAYTGGGGNHILFRHRPGITNARGGSPVGIDVRGDGDTVIC
jgi:hypothetical protein